MNKLGRASSVVAALVAALALAAGATADVAPAPLTGEEIFAVDQPVSTPPFAAGQMSAAWNCSPGFLTYDATGPAVGPYPGTFQESGRFEWGSAVVGTNVPLTGFDARFTIAAPDALVVGRKGFAPGPFAVVGCEEQPYGSFVFAQAGAQPYVALIRTPEGTSLDRGTSRVVVEDSRYRSPAIRVYVFDEEFASSGLTPFEKKQCKDGEFAGLFAGGEKECKDFVKDKGAK